MLTEPITVVTRIAELKARIRELEDALRPFAQLDLPEYCHDSVLLERAIFAKDIRKAKEILDKK